MRLLPQNDGRLHQLPLTDTKLFLVTRDSRNSILLPICVCQQEKKAQASLFSSESCKLAAKKISKLLPAETGSFEST
jgi:hypothetical protein